MNILLFLPLLSVFVAPWWVTVPLAVLTALIPRGWITAVATGVLLDATYGAPISLLGSTEHMYTLVLGITALGGLLLADRVMDYDA